MARAPLYVYQSIPVTFYVSLRIVKLTFSKSSIYAIASILPVPSRWTSDTIPPGKLWSIRRHHAISAL